MKLMEPEMQRLQDHGLAAETYRLVVKSADEAVHALRERFGDEVQVVSVRSISAPGLKGILGSRQLEVVAKPSSPDSRPQPVAASHQESVPVAEPEEETGRPLGVSTPSLRDILHRSGFSDRVLPLIGQSSARPGAEVLTADSRTTHRSLIQLGEALRGNLDRSRDRALPKRVAFIGTTGSGRTTALCKWLGRNVFQNGSLGRVIRLELDEPNRAVGLDLLCEALGLVLEHLGPDGILTDSVSDFEYIHCPAISLNSESENASLLQFLDHNAIEGRVLVVNAAYDAAVIRRIVGMGRALGATHFTLTHFDELMTCGRLWEAVLDCGLAPLFVSTSPSLTGGIDMNVSARMLQKTLPGF